MVAAAIMLVVGASCSPVEARVVGIVFDDSGSMKTPIRKRQNAIFALQLITSVLDLDKDQLLVRRLSENLTESNSKYINVPLEASARQSAINRISSWQVRGGTPFYAVKLMLQDIIERTKPGDEAVLVILTDGAFAEDTLPIKNPSSTAEADKQLQKYFSSYTQRFRGRLLRTYFITLSPKPSERREIAKQRIRSNLLSALGATSDADIRIDDADDFYERFRDLTVRIVGADITRSSATTIQNRQIEIKPPFSVSRLAIIIPGAANEPPTLVAKTFQVSRQLEFNIGDRANQHLRARIYHLIPAGGLQPGSRHRLTFSSPFPHRDKAYIFYINRVRVQREIWSHNTKIERNPNTGAYHVFAGDPFEVRAFLIDEGVSSTEPVTLSKLPERPQFTIDYVDPDGRKRVELGMAQVAGRDYASHQFKFDKTGRSSVIVKARYAGFFDRRATDLRIVVTQRPKASISLSLRPNNNCLDCASNDIPVIRTATTRPTIAATIEIRHTASSTGQIRLTLSRPLPEGLSFVSPDGSEFGKPRNLTTVVTIPPGSSFNLKVQRAGTYTDTRSYRRILTAETVPKQPFVASNTLRFGIKPKIAKLALRWVGNTHDPSGRKPFKTKVTDLDPNSGLFLAVEGLQGKINRNHLKISSQSATLQGKLRPRTNTFLIAPVQKVWPICSCFEKSGLQRFNVSYGNSLSGQMATISGQYMVLPVHWVPRCLPLILLTLFVLLVTAYLVLIIRNPHFPARSALRSREAREEGRSERLHRRTWWLFPIRAERRSIAGFTFRARRHGGVEVLNSHFPPDTYYRNRSLERQFEAEQSEVLVLDWNTDVTEGHDRYKIRHTLVEEDHSR